MSLANATEKVIKVKAYMTEVTQGQSAAKEITLGANASLVDGGGGNIKVKNSNQRKHVNENNYYLQQLKVGSSQYKFGEHLASTDVYPHARGKDSKKTKLALSSTAL